MVRRATLLVFLLGSSPRCWLRLPTLPHDSFLYSVPLRAPSNAPPTGRLCQADLCCSCCIDGAFNIHGPLPLLLLPAWTRSSAHQMKIYLRCWFNVTTSGSAALPRRRRLTGPPTAAATSKDIHRMRRVQAEKNQSSSSHAVIIFDRRSLTQSSSVRAVTPVKRAPHEEAPASTMLVPTNDARSRISATSRISPMPRVSSTDRANSSAA